MSDFDVMDRDEESRSDLFNLLSSHKHTVEQNFTAHENYALADVLWIADPTGYDEDGVQKIKEYLVNDNKTVVITYNIQSKM